MARSTAAHDGGPGAPSGRWRRPRRLLVPTRRADLRVTWHGEDDVFVLSLWHDDECVGSAPLTAGDGAEVASFLVARLGERGRWQPHLVEATASSAAAPGLRARLAAGVDRLLGRRAGG